MKLTADDLKELGAIEKIIEEDGFSDEYFARLKADAAAFFEEKSKIGIEELTEARYERFRRIK